MSIHHYSESKLIQSIHNQPVNLLLQARSRISRQIEWQQQNNLPALVSQPKKYQVYAQTLMDALQAVSQEEDGLIYTMQSLQADYSALITQMHKYASEDIALQAPTLEVFARTQGDEITNRLLFVFIRQFTESVNIKHTLTLLQTLEMASLVQVEFRDLSLTDVLLCLRNTKSGKYGQLYESFDFVKLGEFLRKYRQEKETMREQKHKDLKHAQSSVLYDIVSNLDKAPEEFREPFQSLSAQKLAQSLSQSTIPDTADQPPIGVNVDELLADINRPAPKLRRPKPLTESENRQRIMAELAPYLDRMTNEEYEFYLQYYETSKQPELVEWLSAEWKKRQEKSKTKAS